MQQQMQEQALQAQAQEKELDRAHDFAKMDKELEKAITLEQLKAGLHVFDKGLDADGDGIKDEVELEKTKMNIQFEAQENEKQRQHEARENEKKIKADLEKARISAAKKAKI